MNMIKAITLSLIVAGGCVIFAPPAKAHVWVCMCTADGPGPHGEKCGWGLGGDGK